MPVQAELPAPIMYVSVLSLSIPATTLIMRLSVVVQNVLKPPEVRD